MMLVSMDVIDESGTVINHFENILNTLHVEGEEFLLRAAFTGGVTSTVIPEKYYLGLDNRTTVAVADLIDDLSGEPSGGGYERQEVESSGDFTVSYLNGNFIAMSPVVAFRATGGGGGWGPVRNVFLTDAEDNSGILISSLVLPQAVTVPAGLTITARIGITMRAPSCD